MNHVILTGRLTKEPETRYTKNNKAVCSVTVAVDDGKDEDGNRRSQFIPCVAWGKTAELIDEHFSKGDPITVVGRITVRNYVTKEGDRRYVTEVTATGIEFPLTRRPKDEETPNAPGNAFADIADDDPDVLPF